MEKYNKVTLMTYWNAMFQTAKYFILRDVICLCLRDQLESTTAISNSSMPSMCIGMYLKSVMEREVTICKLIYKHLLPVITQINL